MNLLKGAAPTAAPSFLPTTPHHQGLSMPWLPPRPFFVATPAIRVPCATAPATALIVAAPPPSGFIYAAAPAAALIVAAPPPSVFRPPSPSGSARATAERWRCRYPIVGPLRGAVVPPALVCIIIYDYLCGKIIVLLYWRHREPYPHAS